MSWQVRVGEGGNWGEKGGRSTMLNWSHLSQLWIGRCMDRGYGWMEALCIMRLESSLCNFRAMSTTSLSPQTWSRTLWLLDTTATFGLPARDSTWVQLHSFLPSLNPSSRVKICKTQGRSIAWKGFNFWRAYEPSWAPVTAFVMGEMWNRIRAGVEFSGSCCSARFGTRFKWSRFSTPEPLSQLVPP